MSDTTIPISEVPKDIDPGKVGSVTNPNKEDFVTKFDGEKIVLKAGETAMYPLPRAIHVAFHLCEQAVRREFKKGINAIKDEARREKEAKKAITGYKPKILAMMKTIVQTDSDYLDKVDPRELR
jgi:hypothetical protein